MMIMNHVHDHMIVMNYVFYAAMGWWRRVFVVVVVVDGMEMMEA